MGPSRMPYQCMARLGNILIAARGSSIDSLNISDGSLLSTWNCPSTPLPEISNGNATPKKPASESKPALEKSESSSVDVTLDVSGSPPAKKRRLSKDEEKQPPKELVGQNPPKKKQNNRSDAVASGLEAPAVIALAVTRDGRHVVAVTGEDKTIRVFQTLSNEGYLEQISERMMPKRPCALAITKDSSTIISADKFGDVYSLPLIPPETLSAPDLQPTQESTIAPKPFVPAANEFTIHSERNRKALENQRRQTNQKPEREGRNFEHTLLLGHVSMLTDVILAYLPGTGRSCILTADRDEHIRVSRGIPQTHVIEGFCLGHTEFISRLCIPSTRPELLISGGGDEELFVWEWLSGQLISKCNISSHINEIMKDSEGSVKPAISSIHHTTLSSSGTEIVVVASEGVPAIFIFTLTMTPHPHLQHAQTIPLPGNALSIVLPGGAEDGILVSIDTIHKPGSPSQCHEPNEESEPTGQKEQIEQRGKAFKREDRERRDDLDVVDPVLLFSFEGDKFGGCKALVKATEMVDVETEKSAVGRLGNLLYNLENLRKREGDAGEE